MIALKMLLTIAGVLMMAVAVAIPLYGLWKQIRHAMKKKSRRRRIAAGDWQHRAGS